MEIKLDDEAFNKLQKKVIEELVAKLKLLERKTSLLSKENSLQSGVIMQLKKYHSTKSKMLQHCDRGHLFCKKIHARYNYVADHCHYETNHKNDFKVHTRASHGRVKNPCDESQYTASSNRVLSKHIRSVHKTISILVKIVSFLQILPSFYKFTRRIPTTNVKELCTEELIMTRP